MNLQRRMSRPAGGLLLLAALALAVAAQDYIDVDDDYLWAFKEVRVGWLAGRRQGASSARSGVSARLTVCCCGPAGRFVFAVHRRSMASLERSSR